MKLTSKDGPALRALKASGFHGKDTDELTDAELLSVITFVGLMSSSGALELYKELLALYYTRRDSS